MCKKRLLSLTCDYRLLKRATGYGPEDPLPAPQKANRLEGRRLREPQSSLDEEAEKRFVRLGELRHHPRPFVVCKKSGKLFSTVTLRQCDCPYMGCRDVSSPSPSC